MIQLVGLVKERKAGSATRERGTEWSEEEKTYRITNSQQSSSSCQEKSVESVRMMASASKQRRNDGKKNGTNHQERSSLDVKQNEELHPPVIVQESFVLPARLSRPGKSSQSASHLLLSPSQTKPSSSSAQLTFHISNTTSPSSSSSSPSNALFFGLDSFEAFPFPFPFDSASLAPEGRV